MGKKTSIFTGLAVALSALSASSAAAQDKQKAGSESRVIVDRVVAVVNDAVLLHSELMRRVAPLSGELAKIADLRERQRRQAKLKDQLLDDLINEELTVQAAESAKLEVTSKEVEAAFGEIKKQNKLDDTQLAEALRMQGYTMAGYRRDVRRQILRMRAVNALVRPKVKITDDDLRAKYDALGRRSAAVSKVKLRHILIALPSQPSADQIRAAKAKAATVIEKARAGEDFAKLAKQYSDDDGTKNAGGDLGWIERGSITTEWEVIVFAMSKGDTRGPINGPSGLHVFNVADIEKAQTKSFDDMKEELRGQLYRADMDRETRLWLEELRKKAHVEKKL